MGTISMIRRQLGKTIRGSVLSCVALEIQLHRTEYRMSSVSPCELTSQEFAGFLTLWSINGVRIPRNVKN